MARIGSALALFLAASPAWAEVEFYMTADHTKVGLDDTFRVDIVVANAPEGAVVQFPAPRDFDVLSRSESTQMSYSVGAGGAGVIKQVRKYTLQLRATRPGSLIIPPAVLQTAAKTFKTSSLSIDVVKGKLAPDQPPARRAPTNPFGLPPGFGFPSDDDDGDPFGGLIPQPAPPRGDSDIFLRAAVDKPELYAGEQVIMSLLLYSRVDLSSVDGVVMPKFEGFWANDMKTSNNLTPERRDVDGVPYNLYTLRRKVLFPMRAGDLTIEACEADLTSGFMWAGNRIHRKSNALTLRVKPLPPGGKNSLVGQWRLTTQVSQTDVALGDPVQLKIVLEGRGNLEAVRLPPLEVPPSIRVFDPETHDKSDLVHGKFTGTRTVEYVVVPQQTGTFTLPGLSLPYFNPETKQYEEAKTDPIAINVSPGAQGQKALAVPGQPMSAASAPEQKNQLVGGGLKQLRHSARFVAPASPLWSRPFFVPLVVAPLLLTLLFGTFGLARSSLGRETTDSRKRKQARAARKRLGAAAKLLSKGAAADFYGEVERALNSFLEAKLSTPVTGLTRDQLDRLLAQQAVAALERTRLLAVFETCDLGRYAPGMGEASARQRAFDDAAAAMESWS